MMVHFIDIAGISVYVNPVHVVTVIATGEITAIMLNARDVDGKQFMLQVTATEGEIIRILGGKKNET